MISSVGTLGMKVGHTSSDTRHGRIYKGAFQYGYVGAELDSKTAEVSVFPCWIIRVTHIREALSASYMLANVRFLSSMGPDVDCERAPLDEAFRASWRRTRVRALIGVYSVVPLKIRLSVEALQGIWVSGTTGYAIANCEVQHKNRTLLHWSQSHWKGREVGSFSTSSISSISTFACRLLRLALECATDGSLAALFWRRDAKSRWCHDISNRERAEGPRVFLARGLICHYANEGRSREVSLGSSGSEGRWWSKVRGRARPFMVFGWGPLTTEKGFPRL